MKKAILFSIITLAIGCSAADEDTLPRDNPQQTASVESLAKDCDDDKYTCPSGMTCTPIYGCDTETLCTTQGRGESAGCPENGYCKKVDGSLVGCLRMCETDADCKAVNPNLKCGEDDFSSIVGFKFCALDELQN